MVDRMRTREVDHAPDVVDLAFSRWRSDDLFLGAVAILGVLTGAALVAWPVRDALTIGQLDNEGRTVFVVIGLMVGCCMGWGLRDFRTFMRSRLLVDATGVHLDASGRTTYRWAQIESFDVIGPHDFMGLPSAGGVMRLCDGQHIPLVRLHHLGGDGRNSERAVIEISERVAILNRLLADAAGGPATVW